METEDGGMKWEVERRTGGSGRIWRVRGKENVGIIIKFVAIRKSDKDNVKSGTGFKDIPL